MGKKNYRHHKENNLKGQKRITDTIKRTTSWGKKELQTP